MDGVEFLLMGPLEVRSGGRPLPIGGARQRSVLAQLLLHAGEVVSTERLVDGLWGESPPATATTALQGYVSQLRKALGPDVIVTREPGYLIRVGPGELDVARFRERQRRAREAMAAGDTAMAFDVLDEALALWRGRPLADLINEPFASDAARELEELRLGAIEERFDAGLALGRTRELVPDIEAAVRSEPLREHLRGQLMLALYRSGRQADALRAYDDARHVLVEELGIEPGGALRQLHQRILEQAPELDLPASASATATATGAPPAVHRRRARWIVIGALGAAAVAAVVLVLVLGGSGDGAAPRATANSVTALSTGGIERSIPVGGNPTSVAIGANAIWALNADDQTVTRIDARSHHVRTFGTGGVPVDIAFGHGSLWVANGSSSGGQFVGPVARTVSRLDPDSAAIVARVALPAPHGAVSNQSQYHIAIGPHSVWTINPDFSVSRIDPESNRVVERIQGLSAIALAADGDDVWALEADGTIARLARGAGRVVRRVRVPAASLTSIAVGAGSVWLTDPYGGNLWRVDPQPTPVERTIALGAGANDVAVGASGVWVANGLSGTVSRVDPRTNRVVETVPVGNTPGRLSVAGKTVWVAVAGAPGESLAAASHSAAGALPASVCGSPFFGGAGRPDRLIVSDFPLRGGPGVPTRQMSAAIAYVLREHGFRAGRFKVAYQSCDDSTARTGIFDDRKCIANAKAFVGNKLVAGVIGPYNSGCAFDELPIANRGGPLAMISPTASSVALTHADQLTPPHATDLLYPTGTRSFARLYPSEDVQGAAMARYAKNRGLRNVYVLDDHDYGAPMAAGFRQAASRLHLTLAGSASWDPRAGDYSTLAGRVARSHADAVYLSGLIDSQGGEVLKALRARLGPGVTILAGDGFLPVAALFDTAGDAARGVYVSAAALPTSELGLRGREFVTRFAATQHGARVDHAAVYAAQATEILLDAIGRSDGSRASVTRALLGTRVRDGILGSFGFDANGDTRRLPVTVVRAERPGGDATVESIDGAAVAAVVAP